SPPRRGRSSPKRGHSWFGDRALKRNVAAVDENIAACSRCIKKQASPVSFRSMRGNADGGGFAHPRGFALKFTRPGSITQPTHLESGFVVRLAGRGLGQKAARTEVVWRGRCRWT